MRIMGDRIATERHHPVMATERAHKEVAEDPAQHPSVDKAKLLEDIRVDGGHGPYAPRHAMDPNVKVGAKTMRMHHVVAREIGGPQQTDARRATGKRYGVGGDGIEIKHVALMATGHHALHQLLHHTVGRHAVKRRNDVGYSHRSVRPIIT